MLLPSSVGDGKDLTLAMRTNKLTMPADITEARVLKELGQEEEDRQHAGTAPLHETTPAAFMYLGLEIEGIQWVHFLYQCMYYADNCLDDAYSTMSRQKPFARIMDKLPSPSDATPFAVECADFKCFRLSTCRAFCNTSQTSNALHQPLMTTASH